MKSSQIQHSILQHVFEPIKTKSLSLSETDFELSIIENVKTTPLKFVTCIWRGPIWNVAIDKLLFRVIPSYLEYHIMPRHFCKKILTILM